MVFKHYLLCAIKYIAPIFQLNKVGIWLSGFGVSSAFMSSSPWYYITEQVAAFLFAGNRKLLRFYVDKRNFLDDHTVLVDIEEGNLAGKVEFHRITKTNSSLQTDGASILFLDTKGSLWFLANESLHN